MLFLPPPPEHPPPSDIGTPPDSPDHNPANMGRSSLRGSAPYAHLRGSQGPSYSDGEYQQPGYSVIQQQQTQPLLGQQTPMNKCRTMSPHSHVLEMARNGAYSPVRAMSEPERGPTPPVRGYKLVPIGADETPHQHPNSNIPYQHLPQHASDNEANGIPQMHMYANHTPPSPAPPHQDHQALDRYGRMIPDESTYLMDTGCQSSLPSLNNHQSPMQPHQR